MITQLEIKNFRGFSEYKINDVGQVNLLVGTNNCGKTSVLEAIHLLKSRGNTSVLIFILSRRGELLQNDRDAEGDLCRIFYGFRLIPKFTLSINAVDNIAETISIIINEINEIQYVKSNDPAEWPGRYQLCIEYENNKISTVKEKYSINYTGGVSCHYMQRMSHAKSSIADNSHIEFVPAVSLDPKKVIALFDNISLTPDEELVLEAVRIIEPDIVRLASFVGGSDPAWPLRAGDYIRGGILVKSSKWEERIPIGSFGDGIWRLLGLALSLVAAKNGTLLIDEIDTGLHHTVMSKMWRLICATAKKLNVQVFATTHSRDCWETLADNAVEDEFSDMPIRIHRINKDKKQATTFTNREMHLALNRELEVR